MKKNFIIQIMFSLMILVMGIVSCTEDSIMMDAGKLPDEAGMETTGSTLRSNLSFSGKAIIELTAGSDEEQVVTDEIYYMLSRPTTQDVTVTVKLETEMSQEFKKEIEADNEKIKEFNKSMIAMHWRQKPLLRPAVFPATHVISGGGELTVPAGKDVSSAIRLTLSMRDLPTDYDVYELLFSVEQTNATGQGKKQYLRYRLNVRQKAGDMIAQGGATVQLDTKFLTVFYLNVSAWQPILADIFMYKRYNSETFQEDGMGSLGNIVNLRPAIVDYDKDSKRALLALSSDLRYVLENADIYIRLLQEHGRKVCLCISGGAKGMGFCNMNDEQIADFTRQVKDVIDIYRLDGVNLWDEDSGYGKAGMPVVNTTSYPKLIKSLRTAMPSKMLTVVDKDEPTANFYDSALCDGIEVGRYIDYAWHGYVNEEEKVQIIEPWTSEQHYSEYIRKPIAGLTAERYGNINIPCYPVNASGLYVSSQERISVWKKNKNSRKNNIIVFGTDLIGNIQNQYEGSTISTFNFIGVVADDGHSIFNGVTENGKYSYMIEITEEHARKYRSGYLYLAKDW